MKRREHTQAKKKQKKQQTITNIECNNIMTCRHERIRNKGKLKQIQESD